MPLYDDFDREKFYRNLKYLAKKHKMTMKSLSEKIGISEGYLAKVGHKNSEIMPGINTIQKIMSTLDVTFEQLCYEELGRKTSASMPEFDEVDFLQQVLQKTQNDELDWEQARFDENTNCPQEELLDLVPWDEDAGVYTYKSGFAVECKEKRQARLPFYVARIGNGKCVIISGYSLYKNEIPNFDAIMTAGLPAKDDVFFEIYIYIDNKIYPVAESNPQYESRENRVLVGRVVKNVEEYVNQRKKRVVFKNFFGEETR